MWDWDVDSGTVYMDERCVELMGYLPGQLAPTFDALANDSSPCMPCARTRLIANPSPSPSCGCFNDRSS